MKKVLLTLGILLIVVAVAALLLAAMWHYAAYHLMDGASSTYILQNKLMWIHLVVGAAAAIAGVVCLILRNRY